MGNHTSEAEIRRKALNDSADICSQFAEASNTQAAMALKAAEQRIRALAQSQEQQAPAVQEDHRDYPDEIYLTDSEQFGVALVDWCLAPKSDNDVRYVRASHLAPAQTGG